MQKYINNNAECSIDWTEKINQQVKLEVTNYIKHYVTQNMQACNDFSGTLKSEIGTCKGWKGITLSHTYGVQSWV